MQQLNLLIIRQLFFFLPSFNIIINLINLKAFLTKMQNCHFFFVVIHIHNNNSCLERKKIPQCEIIFMKIIDLETYTKRLT